jgi:hypothetical protein
VELSYNNKKHNELVASLTSVGEEDAKRQLLDGFRCCAHKAQAC